MTSYWNDKFMRHVDKESIKTIFEVGARYGDESIELSKQFSNSKVYSFECNPLTVEKCRNNLKLYTNICFIDYGLGVKNEELPFYSYVKDNDGASSLLKRIDFEETQKQTGIIKIKKLVDFVYEYSIPQIDLLCMDVQGYELNILKGSESFIQNIKYVIMEEPKPIINTTYLPKDTHSKYIGSPSSAEIRDFMYSNGFIEVERLQENLIEDNVMYKNTRFN
jgi:FkbM family methyltransferase